MDDGNATEDATVSLTLSREQLIAVCRAIEQDRPPKRKARLQLLKGIVESAHGILTADDYAPTPLSKVQSKSKGKSTGKASAQKWVSECAPAAEGGGVGGAASGSSALAAGPRAEVRVAAAGASAAPPGPQPWPFPAVGKARSGIIIVGCGEVAQLYAHCIASKPGFIIAGVCDLNLNAAKTMAATVDSLNAAKYSSRLATAST
eukprot:gene26419-21547_t